MLFSILCMVLLFIYVPMFQRLFGTTAIDAAAWGRILLFGVLLFVAVEAEKGWLRWRERKWGNL